MIIIENYREGYSPDQVRNTCTVRDLLDYLSELDAMGSGDDLVYISNDNGYTYSGVVLDRISVEVRCP